MGYDSFDDKIKYRKKIAKGKKKESWFGIDPNIHLFVIDVYCGYNIIVSGSHFLFVKWIRQFDKAVEEGVRLAHEYIKNGIPVEELAKLNPETEEE